MLMDNDTVGLNETTSDVLIDEMARFTAAETFLYVDADNNGVITQEEAINDLVKHYGQDAKALAADVKWFNDMDANGDSKIQAFELSSLLGANETNWPSDGIQFRKFRYLTFEGQWEDAILEGMEAVAISEDTILHYAFDMDVNGSHPRRWIRAFERDISADFLERLVEVSIFYTRL